MGVEYLSASFSKCFKATSFILTAAHCVNCCCVGVTACAVLSGCSSAYRGNESEANKMVDRDNIRAVIASPKSFVIVSFDEPLNVCKFYMGFFLI